MLFLVQNPVSLKRMKKRFLFPATALLLLLFFYGCKPGTEKKAAYGEGTVVYRVTYPDSLNYGLKSAFFPREIVLVFKNEKAAFIASGGMGMIQLVNLLDHKNRTYVSLLIDRIRANYGCKLTPEEINSNESSVRLEIIPVNETKVIAGVTCKKALAKDLSTGVSSEIFYDESIRFSYGNSPFRGMNNLFLEYTHTINHLTMKLEAEKIDFTTPVDTSLFEIKGQYMWVSQQQLFDYMNSL